MKTNYQPQRTTESKEVITRIARYATKNMLRTKNKSSIYASIVDACMADIKKYGIEKD